MDSYKIAIRSSTQEHLEIEDIKDGLVILKDGGACLVLAVSSTNFNLLSEVEQEATIAAYASLLNSLSFPIQIVVRSQQKDISSYLKLLEETAAKEPEEILKKQIQKYREFVEETVTKNNVLDKKFYFVLLMSPLEIGAARVVASSFTSRKRKLPFAKDYILEQAKINLYPKRDHIMRQLNRLGIHGRQLPTEELIKLYFEIYNPESHGLQMVDQKQYTAPIVQRVKEATPVSQPAVEKPTSEIKTQEKRMEENEDSVEDKIASLVKGATQ